jgi:hypothetical protein
LLLLFVAAGDGGTTLLGVGGCSTGVASCCTPMVDTFESTDRVNLCLRDPGLNAATKSHCRNFKLNHSENKTVFKIIRQYHHIR